MNTRAALLFLQPAFLALLLQACPSNLLAGGNASGRFSPHCDGASFYLTKVDGLSSQQKLNLNVRYALS
jgi:hypothetical protein